MNINLLNIVRRIVAQEGEGILSNPQKLKPLINACAKGEPKEDRVAFGRAIENGFYMDLKRNPSTNRAHVKATFVSRLQTITGYDAMRCAVAIDLLEALAFATFCGKCGTQLQTGNHFCNICGNGISPQPPPPPLALPKLNFRIVGKIGFMLVVFGFFMPIACNMNGFQIAEMASNANSHALAMLLYAVFASALVGGIVGVLLGIKKNVPIAADWIILLVCISSLIGFFILLSSQPIFAAGVTRFQQGAFVMSLGGAGALICHIIYVRKDE